MLSTMLFVAIGSALTPVFPAHLGIGPTYDFPSSAWQLRVGAGVRVSAFRFDAIYERSVGPIETAGTSGCVEGGAAVGGCLSLPQLLGGRLSFYPLTLGRFEPLVFLNAGWASRQVKGHPNDAQNDAFIAGGLGGELQIRPFYGSLWLRVTRYVTYSSTNGRSELSASSGLDIGIYL